MMKNYFTKDDEKLKWTQGKSKKLLDTCVFEVTSVDSCSAQGVRGDYIIMNARDWVIVIPRHDDNFLMVKQWRHGEKALSIEFPGGVIDRGEAPEAAARRELEEETGFKAGKLTKLGSVNPNPALFSNHLHVFLAEDLISTGQQHLDEDEFINYFEMPINEVLQGMGTEQFPHALMGTALAMYLKYTLNHGPLQEY